MRLLGPPGPGGAGHRAGSSTLDPRLLPYTTRLSSIPSEAIDPDELSRSPLAEAVHLSLNPALPIQAGGNGLSRGLARDAARGPGGLVRPQPVIPLPDRQLIATLQVVPHIYLRQDDDPKRREPGRVLLQIGADGVPLSARFLSGPAYMKEKCLSAALDWRFEPLAPHGLQAPLDLVLTFRPQVLQATTFWREK